MDQEKILEIVALIMTIGAPIVTSRLANSEASKLIKFGIASLIAGAAGLIYGFGQVGVATPETILAGILAGVGFAQVVYVIVDAGFKAANGAGLNDQSVMKPEQGIGG